MKKESILIAILTLFLVSGCAQEIREEDCIKKGTDEKLTLSEAKEIAINSKCVEDGSLTDKSFCNEDTGTWWIDLDLKKEGCAPACVISIESKTAEINWRCTGLMP